MASSTLTSVSSVSSITKQISELNLDFKSEKPTIGSHQKQPSQTNVSKLLSKYAAPNPFTQPPTTTRSTSAAVKLALTTHAQPVVSRQKSAASPPSPGRGATQPGIDIGRYDGGLETEDEKRGSKVFGDAAEELALDSSVSRCVLGISLFQLTVLSKCLLH